MTSKRAHVEVLLVALLTALPAYGEPAESAVAKRNGPALTNIQIAERGEPNAFSPPSHSQSDVNGLKSKTTPIDPAENRRSGSSDTYPLRASANTKTVIDFRRDIAMEIHRIRDAESDPWRRSKRIEELLATNKAGFREARKLEQASKVTSLK